MFKSFSKPYSLDKPNTDADPSLKGEKEGNCNRTDCQKPGAVWYNKSTCKYYCTKCMLRISENVIRFGDPFIFEHDEYKGDYSGVMAFVRELKNREND